MTIIITGSSSGIGQYLADYYKKNPVEKVIRLSRTENDFDIKKCSLNIDCDRIDALINCSGIAAMNHSALISPEKVNDIVLTNLAGAHHIAQACLPKMRKHGGRIINISSIAAHLAIEGEAIYAASKAGVESLTRVLAKEYARWNITVNCVAPGPVHTKLIHGIDAAKINRIIDQQAVKRMTTMWDILNVVQFFLREESSMITGQTIVLGGI